MNIKRLIFLFVSLSFFGTLAVAQNGSVRGNVYTKESGELIIGATVVLDGTKYATSTDINGFFTITNIPAGSYKLTAYYLGYDSTSIDINIKKGSVIYQSLTMQESGIELTEVSISAARQQNRTTVNVSQISVSQKQIKALPSVGGEADIAQYLQVLPGIVSTGDQGGQIYIRGGAPVQNKILLDGLNIFNPFHSIGFYSVFETELIRNVDVLTGGFSAEHGGRISAVIDIKTREGNKKRMSGFVSGGPFLAKALIEGPLIKFKENGTSLSYVFTAKNSLIQNTSKSLYSYAAENKEVGLPFSFSDFYGKISAVTSNGSKVNFFGFSYDDRYSNPNIANIGWKNQGVGGNFTLIPSGSDIIIDGVIGVTTYNVNIIEQDNNPRTSDIDEITAGVNFSFFGDKNEVRYGLELRSIRTDFEFINPFRNRIGQEQNTTELALYAKYRQILGKVIIDPSLRVQYYSSLGTLALEPRLGIKYNMKDNLRLKFATGRFTQNILSTSNERDVVNLFNGFLSGPTSIVRGLDGELVRNKLQISHHAVLGFEFDYSKRWQFNVESYIKDFPQLIVVNRNKLDRAEADYVVEKGIAYGIDFSVKYDLPRLNFWLTYSHGYVNRFDGVQTYPTLFDRRHNSNVLVTYYLDKKNTWQVSGRWNLGSGFPFTKTVGFYNQLNFLEGPNTKYEIENPNDVGIIYSSVRNGGRLPYYHRLDFSVTKNFKITKHLGVETNLSVTNAYDRPNIFYFDRIQYKRVNQLPVLPTLSAKFYF